MIGAAYVRFYFSINFSLFKSKLHSSKAHIPFLVSYVLLPKSFNFSYFLNYSNLDFIADLIGIISIQFWLIMNFLLKTIELNYLIHRYQLTAKWH